MAGHRRAYSQEEKDEAVDLVKEHGLAEAQRRSGIPKASLQRWVSKAGLDTQEIHAVVREKTRLAALAAQEANRLRIQEVKAEMIQDLASIASRSLKVQLQVIDVVENAQRQVTDAGVTTEEVEALTNRIAMVQGGVPLRDLIALSTRSIHDLQLLTGEDTERGSASGGITVVLAAPPPQSEAPKIIDLPAEPRALEG